MLTLDRKAAEKCQTKIVSFAALWPERFRRAKSMKTTAVSSRAKSVNDLLKKARRKTLILEAADGSRYVLAPLDAWEGVEVGQSGDITTNKRLMRALAARRSAAPTIGLAELKADLGLE